MKTILATLAVGALLGSSAAYANHIDFLDDGAFTLTQSGFGQSFQTVTGIDPGSTLGGQRTVRLFNLSSGTASASLGPAFAPGADNDALTYTTTVAGVFQNGIGGGSDLNANFLDIPGMAGDWDRIRLDFGPGSSAAASVQVQLFSREEGETLFQNLAFAGGDNNLDFLYSDFVPIIGGPATGASDAFLRNVDQARFQINAPIGGGTYIVESFNRNGFVPEDGGATDVPEPGSLGLMALGLALLGLVAVRRRV